MARSRRAPATKPQARGSSKAKPRGSHSPKKKALTSGPTASTAAHEGATTGRRLGLWGTSGAGPNTVVGGSIRTLRARSRELIRNNPWARSGLGTLVANMIGTGITPSWSIPEDPELAKTIRRTWDRWCNESDAAGQLDFYGMTSLAAREVVEAGEVLARFRPRRASDRMATVPLQVQGLESDFLDELRDAARPGGGYVQLGIEFNAFGRRTAYWLRRSHPGDFTPMSAAGGFDSVPVPADEVLHIGIPERFGQIRYLPWLSSLILRLYELDQMDDATLVRQKISSLIAGFMYDDGGGATPGIARGTNASGQEEISLEPGTMQRVPPGINRIEWSEPPGPGTDFAPFVKYQLRAAAAGLMLTYEQLSGDYSDSNFSSHRTALVEFRRKVETIQWQIWVFQWCRPIVARWMDHGVATGTLPIPAGDYAANRAKYTDIRWRPPRWPYLEPVKDVAARIMEMRAGLKPRSVIIAEDGEDAVEFEDTMAEDNQRADDRGLVLDSDPRKVTQSGTAQTNAVLDGTLREPSA